MLSKIAHILIIKNLLVVTDGIFLYPCYYTHNGENQFKIVLGRVNSGWKFLLASVTGLVWFVLLQCDSILTYNLRVRPDGIRWGWTGT
jgi:hypothetical protein